MAITQFYVASPPQFSRAGYISNTNSAYEVGDRISIGLNVYRCVTAGVSSGTSCALIFTGAASVAWGNTTWDKVTNSWENAATTCVDDPTVVNYCDYTVGYRPYTNGNTSVVFVNPVTFEQMQSVSLVNYETPFSPYYYSFYFNGFLWTPPALSDPGGTGLNDYEPSYENYRGSAFVSGANPLSLRLLDNGRAPYAYKGRAERLSTYNGLTGSKTLSFHFLTDSPYAGVDLWNDNLWVEIFYLGGSNATLTYASTEDVNTGLYSTTKTLIPTETNTWTYNSTNYPTVTALKITKTITFTEPGLVYYSVWTNGNRVKLFNLFCCPVIEIT